MTCCGTSTCSKHFDRKRVLGELRNYQQHGPVPTTRALIQALQRAGAGDGTLLDIGGGVGAIQYALLAAGASGVTSVEASQAYLDAACGEAARQGWSGRIRYQFGDFVDVAAAVPGADIVTLDRVVCCYPNMEGLVRLSVERCRRLYGLVYPRNAWWVRAVIWLENLVRRLLGNSFRSFVHSPAAMDALITSSGFKLQQQVRTFVWEVGVYARSNSS